MNDERFNKVFIGSGLVAELFLHALIRHKGESPEDFYILGKQEDRCERLKKNIRLGLQQILMRLCRRLK